MIRLFNVCLVCCVLLAATVMYSLEHHTRGLEREIAQMNAAIREEKEQIKLYTAEWASLTRPDRIEMLARKKLGMVPLDSTQVLRPGDLTAAIPERAPNALAADAPSPIGELIETIR
jgi:cell division protein FtsL